MNDKTLRIDKLYGWSILVAIGYLFYSIFLKQKAGIDFIETFSLFPIVFLILQRPIRLMFRNYFGEEPELDSKGKLSNKIYTIILIVSTIAISFIINSFFE